MNNWFLRGDYGTATTDWQLMLIGLLLAFVCGHVVAWVYMLTHSGLSYSRSYVNSLVLMPVLVALVMMILSNNLVLAFGLMAIFAMVRFRSVLRDTLDTSYVLAVIVLGLACGTLKFSSAICGCAATVAIMLYFHVSRFGTRHRYDLILNVQWLRPASELGELRLLLERHARRTFCASQRSREDDSGVDLSYRLLLRDPARSHELVSEIRALAGVSHVTALQSGEESEV
ncbi:MAG TPA: DUF4956 domain-containing protein [Verrucomicrobiae bacterium]|nr:DUF4956 domain-containing protein [Verrucomicrobiae bacterium]